MIDEFNWQLCLYENRHDSIPAYRCEEPVSSIAPVSNDKRVATFKNDITVLEQTYGKLYPGKTIKIDLGSACSLLHRERHRTDAFSRLVKFLSQEYQTNLIITSRKKQNYDIY